MIKTTMQLLFYCCTGRFGHHGTLQSFIRRVVFKVFGSQPARSDLNCDKRLGPRPLMEENALKYIRKISETPDPLKHVVFIKNINKNRLIIMIKPYKVLVSC